MKKVILLLFVCALTFTSVSASTQFVDVKKEAWYYQWVNLIKDLDITIGYNDNTFKPDEPIKRIEFLSFTMKSLGYNIPIAKGYWGENIIDKAVELNIISHHKIDLCYSNPEGYITREESARVIYNVYLKDNNTFDSDTINQVKLMITDFKHINTLYQEGVVGVVSLGIVEGYDNLFNPAGLLTRAEAAVMISRLVLPEKRQSVNLELFTYSYTSNSKKTTNFKVFYQTKDQDIYNILTIADYIENIDPVHGFASVYNLSDDNSHKVELYSSQDDYDFNNSQSLDNYKNWEINLQKADQTKEDSILITSWRKSAELDNEETMKSIFNYLFAEDADKMWQLYFEIASKPLTSGVSISNESESFGRIYMITADEEKVELSISKKEDALPVEIVDGKLIVKFSSILSDGTYGTVTLEDVTDDEST